MWRVVAARAAGTSHLRTGTPCQDAFAVARVGACLLLFAADGAGSAARAEAGSRLAVEAALEAARIELGSGEPVYASGWRAILERTIRAARSRLEADLANEGGALRDLSTTFLGVLWSPPWLAAVQIGDGWIVVDTGKSLCSLLEPVRGEHSNETIFVTSSGYAASARYEVLARDGIAGVALLTDGLETIAMDLADGTPHASFFHPLFAQARAAEDDTGTAAAEQELAAFLRSEAVCEWTEDDKTLILAVRAEAS
jgi:Protein phosphatase 2C